MRRPQDEEEDWSELFGCKFTGAEIREAADFADMLSSYGTLMEGMLISFIRENMKLGHRLFLIMNLTPNELGVMAMRESDDRLTHVIKERCGEENRKADGRSKIILPGEA